MSHQHLITEFERYREPLGQAARRLEGSLCELLSGRGVPVHFVSSRVKSPLSLTRKLARPEKTYRTLWEVTDLVGLRVATSFEDAIETVARLIEATHAVDFTHSTDKLRFTHVDRFGYRSLHYVCADPASGLPEAFRFEIQVRTALQHAWAEVEHDLGYKADAVPERIRRRFSRVASLLEVADEEFVAIREELAAYETKARQAVERPDKPLPIDAVTVRALSRSDGVQTLDQRVAEALKRPLGEHDFFPEYLARLLVRCGLTSTREVEAALSTFGPRVGDAAKRYFDFSARRWGQGADTVKAIEHGYALFFLAHLALAEGPELTLSKVARLTGTYQALDELDEREAHEVASSVLEALRG